MEFHEVAAIFPMMQQDEYAALVADMRVNGQREPIWTYQGKIIDGRNRYRACLELDRPPAFREWDGNGSLVAFVVSLNLNRRHLNSSQKAVIALAIEKALAVEARERQVQAAIDTNIQLGRLVDMTERDRRLIAANTAFVCPTCSDLFDRKVWHCPGCDHHWQMYEMECRNCHQHKQPKTVVQKFAQPSPRSRDQAADLASTNRQYVSDAKRIAATAPDVLEAVRNGRVHIPAAKQLAQLPEDARASILKRLEARQVKDVKEEVRAARAAMPKPPRQESVLPLPSSVRLEVADAAALPLDADSVNLIVTSPPYGLSKDYADYTDPSEGWYFMMQTWLAEMHRVTKPGGRLALNVPFDTTDGGNRPTWPQACKAATDAGWAYRWAIVWNEGNVSKSVARGSIDSPAAPHVITPVEVIGVFYKGAWGRTSDAPADLEHDEWLEWTNGLWTFRGEGRAWEGHPAAFPEELPRRLIKLLSYPGDTVLDPFAGSGTTPLVAWQLGRVAIGFDHAPAYIDSARRRLVERQGVAA